MTVQWLKTLKRNHIIMFILFFTLLTATVITIASSIPITNYHVTPTVPETISRTSQYLLPIATIGHIAYSDHPPPINQSTRITIYSFISNNPGIHFRGICRSLGLTIGVVQFHLNILVSSGLVSSIHYRRRKRFFPSKQYSKNEKIVLSLLREKTVSKILCLLIEKHEMFHTKLSSTLGITSQAISWQIRRLKSEGLIEITKDNMKQKYSLTEQLKPMIQQCLTLIH